MFMLPWRAEKLSIMQMIPQLVSCLLSYSEGEGMTGILVKKNFQRLAWEAKWLVDHNHTELSNESGEEETWSCNGRQPCAHGVQRAAFGVRQRRMPGKCGKPYKCVHCIQLTAAGTQLSHLSLAGRLPVFCIWENSPVINHPVVSESQVFSREEPAALQVMGGSTDWQGSQSYLGRVPREPGVGEADTEWEFDVRASI